MFIELLFLCVSKEKVAKRKDTSQGRLVLIAPTLLRLPEALSAANDASCVVVAAAVIHDGLNSSAFNLFNST